MFVFLACLFIVVFPSTLVCKFSSAETVLLLGVFTVSVYNGYLINMATQLSKTTGLASAGSDDSC